jgi:VWFA-related protein
VGRLNHFGIGVTAAALMLGVIAPFLAARNYQNPQIKVSTRLVEFGVIARDKDGPVPDMTKDDFVVLDRGKPQQVSVFTIESASAAIPQLAKMLPPNTFSDLPQYGAGKPRSITIVLLDNLNTLYGSAPESKYESTPYWVEDLALQRAKTHFIDFIKTLDPRDRVAIYGLRDSLHVLCDFTNDRDQLLAILSKYDTSSATNRAVVEPGRRTAPVVDGVVPGESAGFENEAVLTLAGMANEERAQITMAALSSIANHVANIPGRKNLVWLTANLPFSGAAMARILGPANIAVYPVDARGLLAKSPTVAAGPWHTADFDPELEAPGQHNIPAQSSQPIGIATMQKVAEETGGEAFVNTNDITGAIRKAVEDSTVTYTLGFYLNADSLDGKFHEIKVQSTRKDVTLRYPKGYFAYRDTSATQDQDQKSLVTAVRSPIESSSIPLEATLARVNQPEANSLSITCSIDVHNVQWVQATNLRKGTVVVYVVEQDPSGKVLQQWNRPFNLQFTDTQYAALLKQGLVFRQTVHPHEGTSTLRLLVEDPNSSQVGSLIIPMAQVN